MPIACCPHCLLPMSEDAAPGYPLEPMRCPSCRLAVAPGRAKLGGDTTSQAVGSGAAAGVLKNAARRADEAATTPQEVADALVFAATKLGTSVLRLRMLDYEYLTRAHADLPSVGTVLATHGSWKRARREVDDAQRAAAAD
ncbi:MAG: hypothetical protein JWN65_2830 [Solirubrobacterales bacterium]|jgi:hypothetical protein|nr:hypothetical protein [Solirubrobacterales bacterium]